MSGELFDYASDARFLSVIRMRQIFAELCHCFICGMAFEQKNGQSQMGNRKLSGTRTKQVHSLDTFGAFSNEGPAKQIARRRIRGFHVMCPACRRLCLRITTE